LSNRSESAVKEIGKRKVLGFGLGRKVEREKWECGKESEAKRSLVRGWDFKFYMEKNEKKQESEEAMSLV
jgi:hypothetical protein